MEKVAQELGWSCTSTEINSKVKIMSVSALIIRPVTTPVQQLFEELCSLYLETYACKFAILNTRTILKPLWFINKKIVGQSLKW